MKRSWGFLIARQYNYQFENFYATVIQQAYRNYKKRPESLAKQIWEVVRNDVIPNEKKFLGIVPRKIRIPNYNDWIMERKCQLWERLGNVVKILVTKFLYQQGYIVVQGSYWIDILKWLWNPEYNLIDKKSNRENIIKISECEKYRGKASELIFVFLGEDLFDLDDNCE